MTSIPRFQPPPRAANQSSSSIMQCLLFRDPFLNAMTIRQELHKEVEEIETKREHKVVDFGDVSLFSVLFSPLPKALLLNTEEDKDPPETVSVSSASDASWTSRSSAATPRRVLVKTGNEAEGTTITISDCETVVSDLSDTVSKQHRSMERSAVVLQSHWRAVRARRKYSGALRSLILQRCIRNFENASIKYTNEDNAASCIQNYWRTRKSRSSRGDLLDTRSTRTFSECTLSSPVKRHLADSAPRDSTIGFERLKVGSPRQRWQASILATVQDRSENPTCLMLHEELVSTSKLSRVLFPAKETACCSWEKTMSVQRSSSLRSQSWAFRREEFHAENRVIRILLLVLFLMALGLLRFRVDTLICRNSPAIVTKAAAERNQLLLLLFDYLEPSTPIHFV